MADETAPRLYLITPASFELSSFPRALEAVLDRFDVACLRLSLATHDEDVLSRSADALRDLTIARDVAMVIDTHVVLAQRLGLDGVHLTDGSRSVRHARSTLGEDAIVGAYCAQSRHDGMTAGEAGADYVSFGPVGVTALGDGAQAPVDLFEWWSEVIEVPVVAEGAISSTEVTALAEFTDFFGIGPEIWSVDEPADALAQTLAPLRA